MFHFTIGVKITETYQKKEEARYMNAEKVSVPPRNFYSIELPTISTVKLIRHKVTFNRRYFCKRRVSTKEVNVKTSMQT